jgi:hypothetical protein
MGLNSTHSITKSPKYRQDAKVKKFNSIVDLLKVVPNLDWDGAVFVNLNKWNKDPFNVEIYILEGDDELEDLEDIENHYPKIAHKLGIHQLLDIETFQSVLEFQLNIKKESNTEDYLNAINHYREFDDFLDE